MASSGSSPSAAEKSNARPTVVEEILAEQDGTCTVYYNPAQNVARPLGSVRIFIEGEITQGKRVELATRAMICHEPVYSANIMVAPGRRYRFHFVDEKRPEESFLDVHFVREYSEGSNKPYRCCAMGRWIERTQSWSFGK